MYMYSTVSSIITLPRRAAGAAAPATAGSQVQPRTAFEMFLESFSTVAGRADQRVFNVFLDPKNHERPVSCRCGDRVVGTEGL